MWLGFWLTGNLETQKVISPFPFTMEDGSDLQVQVYR